MRHKISQTVYELHRLSHLCSTGERQRLFLSLSMLHRCLTILVGFINQFVRPPLNKEYHYITRDFPYLLYSRLIGCKVTNRSMAPKLNATVNTSHLKKSERNMKN